jgi:SEC-C motif-containing protein
MDVSNRALPALKAPCPCGADVAFQSCCEPYVTGKAHALTPEALMRSRYVAFTFRHSDYVRETWHSKTRPKEIDLASDEAVWLKLKVLHAEGTADDQHGVVEFEAWYGANGRMGCQKERSRFEREDGRWYYVDGQMPEASQIELKVGRNEQCPCGSEQKYKRCCAVKIS